MKLDKFEKFIKSLFESYNSPVNIRWVDKDDKLIGLFSVNNKVYQINCINKGNDIWTYKFYLFDASSGLSPKLTNFNTGKMSILSTIREGMHYLIRIKNPKGIIFGALDNSEVRKKLYWSYAEEIEKKHGYTLFTDRDNDKQIFILYKDLSKDVLMDVLEIIADEEI